jgi:hypothetical protein
MSAFGPKRASFGTRQLKPILAPNLSFRRYSAGMWINVSNANREKNMRRFMMTSVLLAILFLSGLFAISSAQAMVAPLPAGLAPAIQQANPVDEVQYACRRVRRCGPNGCFWRRECAEYGGGYYGGGYGRGYYEGYGRRTACGPGWSLQDGVCKPYRGY